MRGRKRVDRLAGVSVGALLLLLGLAYLLFVTIGLARDVSLWVFGRSTTATVIDVWAELTSEPDAKELSFRYFVRYQFTTPDGQVFAKTSTVAPGDWAGLGKSYRSRDRSGILGDEPNTASGVYHEQAFVPPFTVGGLEKGGPIAVTYFPLYPAHNRLDESRYVPLLACANVPLLLLGGGVLILGLKLIRSSSRRPRKAWPILGRYSAN
jgi:hypothetical protein